jgi:glycosyltransferase involved in cell wall biosynthesis
LNILNIIQCTNLGGMEQANLIRLTGLRQLGHRCELISLNPLGALAPLLHKNQIAAQGLEYRGAAGWRSFGAMWRAFRESRHDAVIMTGHNLTASIALGTLCRERRLLAVHFHHAGVKPAAQWRLIYRLAQRQFGAITFPTDFIRREAESLYPSIAKISHTVRDPLEMKPLRSEQECRDARVALGIPAGVPVIGNAGWLIPRKRFDIFLKTAASILKSYPDAIFLVAGDGPEREKLEELATSLSLNSHLRWLGWQQDLSLFYKSLTVLLFNSEWDALGLTPLEAIMRGIPVVASVANGGLSEILDREEYAFVTRDHDVDLLADKVTSLIRNPGRASASAFAAREHLIQLGAPALHAQQIAKLLNV